MYVNKRLIVKHTEICLAGANGIQLDIENTSRPTQILALYRNRNTVLKDFLDALEMYYDRLNNNKTYVLLGDLNIDLLRVI